MKTSTFYHLILSLFFLSCSANTSPPSDDSVDEMFDNFMNEVLEVAENISSDNESIEDGFAEDTSYPYEPKFTIWLDCQGGPGGCYKIKELDMVKVGCGTISFHHSFTLSAEKELEMGTWEYNLLVNVRYFVDDIMIVNYLDYMSGLARPQFGRLSTLYGIKYNASSFGYGEHLFRVEIEVEDRGIFSKSMKFFVSCCEELCADWGEWTSAGEFHLNELDLDCKDELSYVHIKGHTAGDEQYFIAQLTCPPYEDSDTEEKKTTSVVIFKYLDGNIKIEKIRKYPGGPSAFEYVYYDSYVTNVTNNKVFAYFLLSEIEGANLVVEGEDFEKKINLPIDRVAKIRFDNKNLINIFYQSIPNQIHWVRLNNFYEIASSSVILSISSYFVPLLFDIDLDDSGIIHMVGVRAYDNDGFYLNNINGEFDFEDKILITNSYEGAPPGHPSRYSLGIENSNVHIFLISPYKEIFKIHMRPDGTILKAAEKVTDMFSDFANIIEGKKETELCEIECPVNFFTYPKDTVTFVDNCGRIYIVTNLRYTLMYMNEDAKNIIDPVYGMKYYFTTNSAGKFKSEIIDDLHFLKFNEGPRVSYPGVSVKEPNTIIYSYYNPKDKTILFKEKKCLKIFRPKF